MADNFSLRLEALDDLISKLDQVLTKLDETADRLSRIEDFEVRIRFGKDFDKAAQSLDRLSRSMTRLSAITGSDLDQASRSLVTFITRLENIARVADTANFDSTAFRGLIRGIQDIANINRDANLSSTRGLSQFLDSIKNIVKSLVDIGSDSGEGDINRTRRLLESIRIVINDFFTITERVSETSLRSAASFAIKFRATIGNFIRLSKDLADIGTSLQLSDTNRITEIIDLTKRVVLEVLEFFETLEGRNVRSARRFSSLIGTLTKNFVKLARELSIIGQSTSLSELNRATGIVETAIRVIKTMIDQFANLQGGVGKFAQLIGFTIKFNLFVNNFVQLLRNIVFLTRGLSADQLTGISRLVTGLAGTLSALARFERLLSEINFVRIIALMIKFRLTTGQVVALVRNLIRETRGSSAENLTAVGNLLLGLGLVMRRFDIFFKSLGQINVAQAFARTVKFRIAVSGIVDLVKVLVKIAKNANAQGVEAVAAVLRGLGTSIRAYGEFLRDLQAVTQTSSNNFSFRNIRTFINVAVSLGLLTSAIGRITKSARGVSEGQIKGLGETLTATFRLFEALSKAALQESEFTRLKDRVRDFKDFLDIIQRFAKDLKNLKDVDTAGFASVIDSLRKAFTEVTELNRIDLDERRIKGNLETFERFVRGFKPVFAALKGVKGNSAQGLDKLVTAFVRALRDLSTLEGAKFDSKLLTNFAKDLAKAINTIVRTVKSDIDSEELFKLANALETVNEAAKLAQKAELIRPGTVGDISQADRRMEDLADTTEAVRRGFLRANLQITVIRAALRGLAAVFVELVRLPARFGRAFIDAFNGARSAISGIQNSVRELVSGVREGFSELREAGENIREAGERIVQSFGIGNILESEAFQAAVGFDSLGKQLEVFGGLTEEQRRQAEEFAFEIGKAYPLSANEALGATLDLIKAGQDLSSTSFILPSAADLAALSDSGDLDRATRALIAAQSSFQEFGPGIEGSFENISTASDFISGAADASVASVESITDALANAAGPANAFGLSLLDTTAVLAEFSNVGIDGSEAGTQLRTILRTLRTDTARDELRRLGVSLVDADGNFRDIADIIGDIRGSFDELSLTEEEQADVITKLGGAYGQTGLTALIANDSLDETRETIAGTASASERAADLLDNFEGVITQLRGSVETLLTKALAPLLETFFRPAAEAILFIVNALLSLDQEVLTFISTAVVFASVFATIAGGALVVIGALIQVGAVVGTAVLALTNVVGVILAVAGGLATLVTGFVVIAGAVTGFIALIGGLVAAFRALQTIFAENRGGAVSNLRVLRQNIQETVEIVRNFVASVGRLVGLLFPSGKIGQGQGILDAIGRQIANFFASISRALTGGVIGKIRRGLEDATEIIDGIVSFLTLGDRIDEATAEARDNLIRFGDGFVQGSDEANAIMDQARRRAEGAFNRFAEALASNNLFKRLIGRENVRRGDVIRFAQGIRDVADIVADTVNGVVDDVRNFISRIGEDGFGVAFANLRTDVSERISGAKSQIIPIIASIFDITEEELNQFFDDNSAQAIFTRLLDRIRMSALRAIGENSELLKNVFVFALNFLFNPLKKIETVAELFGAEDVANITGEINRIIDQIFGGIFDTAVGLLEGKTLVDSLREAFGPSIEPILNFATELGQAVDSVVRIIANLITALSGGPQATLEPSVAEQLGVEQQTVGVQQVLESLLGVFDTLAQVIDLIDENVLNRLEEGDVSGALSGVLGIIGSILGAIAGELKTQIESIDFVTIFNDVLTLIRDGFFEAVGTVLTTLDETLGLDLSGVITFIADSLKNVESLQAEGEANPFFTVASAIATAFVAAVQAVFSTIGDLLGLDTEAIVQNIKDAFGPVLDQLAIFFVGTEEQASTLQNIQTFVTNLITLIDNLLAGVFGKGDEAREGGEGLQAAGQIILDFLGGLAGLGLNIVSTSLQTINDVFADLAALDNDQLEALGLALGVIGGALALFTIGPAAILGFLPGVLTALSGISAAPLAALGGGLNILRGAITTFANTLAGKFVAIFAIVQLVRAVLDNVDELVEVVDRLKAGDIGGAVTELIDALGQILVDFGFNVLETLGINEVFGQTRDEILNTAKLIVTGFQAITEVVGQNIRAFFEENVIRPISDFLTYDLPFQANQAALTAEAIGNAINSIGVENVLERIRNDIIGFNEALQSGAIDQSLVDQLAAALTGTGDFQQISDLGREQVRLTAAANAELIANEFTNALREGDLSAQSEQAFIDIFSSIGEGGLRDAISSVLQTQGVDAASLFLQSLVDADVQIPPAVLDQLAGSIVAGFSGALGAEELASRLDQLDLIENLLLAAGLDTASVDAARAQLQERFQSVVDSIPAITPTEPVTVEAGEIQVDVPDDAKVTVNPPAQGVLRAEEEFQLSADAIVEVTPAEGSTLLPPELDNFAIPQTPEDVRELVTALQEFVTQIGTAKTATEEFQTVAGTANTAFQTLDTTVTTLSTNSAVGLETFTNQVGGASAEVQSSIQGVILTLGILIAEIGTLPGAMLLASVLVRPPMAALQATLSTGFITVTRIIRSARNEIQGLAIDIAKAVAAAKRARTELSEGSGQTPPGAAKGANVNKGDIFEVAEAGESEVFRTAGGRLFLLGGAPGRVIPLSGLPDVSSSRASSSAPAPTSVPQGAGGAAIAGLTVQEGDVIIQLGGDVPTSTLNELQARIREEFDRRNRIQAQTLRASARA